MAARKTARKKPARKKPARKKPARKSRKKLMASSLSIEDAWRYVDRFCRVVWAQHNGEEPPKSLAALINALRDDGCVPPHEASMMHSLRVLRNFVVHENLDFGEHELAIARAAWEIVRAWAEQRERKAWQLALELCA
jgi:hypothetical protein